MSAAEAYSRLEAQAKQLASTNLAKTRQQHFADLLRADPEAQKALMSQLSRG